MGLLIKREWQTLAALAGLGLLLVAGCDAAGPGSKETTEAPAPNAESEEGVPEAPPEATAGEAAEGEGEATLDEIEPIPDDIEIADGPAMMSEDEFLSVYAQLEGVTVLDSGVMYRTLTEGEGKSPSIADWVKVQYRGTLMNGEVFDETEGDATAVFEVGGVIKGWQEVLPLMKEGDTWDVAIPSNLAYGETGTDDGEIGPNQPLVFEITLVEVLPAG